MEALETITKVWHLFIAYFAGFFSHIIKEKINEHFKRSTIKWTEKRNLAKYILKIVDLGQNHRYEKILTPDQRQEAENISSLARVFNQKLDSEFRTFLGLWSFVDHMRKVKIPSYQQGEHLKNNLSIISEADSTAERVRKIAEEILK